MGYLDPNKGTASFKLGNVLFQGNQIENFSFRQNGNVVDIVHWANSPDGEVMTATVTKEMTVSGFAYSAQLLPDLADDTTTTFEVSIPNGRKYTGSCKITSTEESSNIREYGKFNITLRCWNVTQVTNGGEYYT